MDNRLIQRRHYILPIAVVLCALPAWSGAQETSSASPPASVAPATRPAEGRVRREGRGEPWGDREGRRASPPLPFPEPPGFAPVSEQEWAQVMESIQKVSPNRWKMLNKMLEGSEKRGAPLRAGVTRRYRELKKLETTDPDRYELEIRRDSIEDAIFGHLDAYRANRNDETKEQIRKQVAALYDTKQDLLKLRVARIDSELAALRMQDARDTLKSESDVRLDTNGREKSINEMVEGFMNHTRPGGGGPRRPRGEGQPGQPPPQGQPPAPGEPASVPSPK